MGGGETLISKRAVQTSRPHCATGPADTAASDGHVQAGCWCHRRLFTGPQMSSQRPFRPQAGEGFRAETLVLVWIGIQTSGDLL